MTTIHPLKRPMANLYLVQTNNKNVLVDTGMDSDFGATVKFLAKHNVKPTELSYIVLTHGHIDHCGSAARFMQEFDIQTIIHKNDAHLVRNGTSGRIDITNFTSRIVKAFSGKPYPAFEPSILLDDPAELCDLIGCKACILTPGHSEGSISMLFDNNEAIIGDIMRGGHLGGAIFPQKPLYHYFINDRAAIDQSIKNVLTWQAHKYYVGHGGWLGYDDMKNKFLKQ